MNKFHAMFRQGATVIVVIILAIAAFWLVGRQVQPEPQPAVAQATDRPTPPPVTSRPTTLPTRSPTDTSLPTPAPTPTPEPTIQLHTPEISLATVTLITPPPPPPTIGPGPLANHQLREVARLPITYNNQYLSLAGWVSSTRLFVFGLAVPADNLSAQSAAKTFVMTLPITQTGLSGAENLPLNQLDSSVRWNPQHPSAPIEQLGETDSFVYRKEIHNHQFELWVSNWSRSQQHLIATTLVSSFAVSEDGLVAYVNGKNQVVIVNPTVTGVLEIFTISLDDYQIDPHSKFFRLSLASSGNHLAISDGHGAFYIIDTATGQANFTETIQAGQIREATWSPNGATLAYTVGGNPDQIVTGGPFLYLQDKTGNNRRFINYILSFDDEPVGIYELHWSPTGEILAAIAEPHQCLDCRDILLFIRKDGAYLQEIEKQAAFRTVVWSPDSRYLAYYCFQEEDQPGHICITEVVNE